LTDDEADTLVHKAADEVNIARQPVELRHRQRTPPLPRFGQCVPKLWSPFKCMSALAAFSFQELPTDLQAFLCLQLLHSLPRPFRAPAGPVLPACAPSQVRHQRPWLFRSFGHWICPFPFIVAPVYHGTVFTRKRNAHEPSHSTQVANGADWADKSPFT